MTAMPSNDFFLQQACLNVLPAHAWRKWHAFLEMGGPVTYMNTDLRSAVLSEWRALRRRYRSDAAA